MRRLEWPPERRGQESVSARRRGGQQKKRRPQQWQRQQELVLFPGVLCGRTSRKVAGHLRHCRRQLPVSIYDNGSSNERPGSVGREA